MPTHPRLGTLHPAFETDGYWSSDPVPLSAFDNQPVPFIFYDLVDPASQTLPPDVDAAIDNVLALGPRLRSGAADRVYDYYCRIRDLVDDDDLNSIITHQDQVWKHVQPTAVEFERSTRDQRVYAIFTCECDWEPEHGLQIVVREGRTLSKVSAQCEGLGDEPNEP